MKKLKRLALVFLALASFSFVDLPIHSQPELLAQRGGGYTLYYCPRCKKNVSAAATYCPYCGYSGGHVIDNKDPGTIFTAVFCVGSFFMLLLVGCGIGFAVTYAVKSAKKKPRSVYGVRQPPGTQQWGQHYGNGPNQNVYRPPSNPNRYH